MANILVLICKPEILMVLGEREDCPFTLWRSVEPTHSTLTEGKVLRFMTSTEQHMKEKGMCPTH